MNFLVSGSPVSHLLTYLTGAGAASGGVSGYMLWRKL